MSAHTRRKFLAISGASLFACASDSFGSQIDQDSVYLINDTHIGEKQPPSSAVPTHLRQIVTELTGLKQKPACVLINGDLALTDGQPGDYRHFAKLITPLRNAKVNLHLTLGNHDNRDAFYQVLKQERPRAPVVKSRHISVISTRFANFFLLDSLKKTMVTQGTLGSDQRNWLAQALDKYRDKPAIIVAHHNPRLGGDPNHFPGGLIDSEELWSLLTARPQVKAYIHGHIHDRSFAQHKGIHIINTPATSYVANRETSTTGWTTARLNKKGITLVTRTTDSNHPWNLQTNTLKWRS